MILYRRSDMRRIGLFMAVVALLISAQVVLASEDSKNTITVKRVRED